MKNCIRKSVSVIMAWILLLGLLPFGVFAQEAAPTAVIESYINPSSLSAHSGAEWDALGLPSEISATLEDKTMVALPVTWISSPEYDGAAGEYLLTASFDGEYVLAEGVSAPTLTLAVEEDKIDALIAAIDALPELDPEAVDVEDDEAFALWFSEQYAVYAEVPALLNQLLSFAKDEEAMQRVGEERANKLASIHDLFFAATSQMMSSDQAEWGLAGQDEAAPENWVDSGSLGDAMDYANSLSSGVAYIRLLSSVNTTEALTFAKGKTTVLDLNGYTIDRGLVQDKASAVLNGNVITINGTFTLKDSIGSGMITGGNRSKEAGNGGGVYVSGTGIFYMKGGKISGNRTDMRGGGVFVNGVFYMFDGEISGNICDYQGGGGVYSNKVVYMSGGRITQNTIKGFGGGMYISGVGKLFMSGNAEISENVAYQGGGVFVSSSSTGQGVFQLHGGSIINNTASSDGGGTFIQGGLVTLSTGTVTGNRTTSGNGGGIYFRNHTNGDVFIPATFAVDGTVNITGNTKGNDPNNLYLGTVELDESSNPNVIKVVGAFTGEVGVTTQDTATLTSPVNVAVSAASHTITDEESKCFVPDDSMNCYAWTDADDSNKVKFFAYNYVTYKGNGNTGGAAPVDVTQYSKDNSTVTVLGAGNLVKTGYTFDGWDTNADGSGTAHAVSGTFTIQENVLLYAQWAANPYTVNYDGNKPSGTSGSVSNVPEAQNCTYDSNYSLGSAPALEGYTFGGWYKEASCTNIVGEAGASVKNTAANGTVTLYAKWTAQSCTVTLDLEGGVSGASSCSATYDSATLRNYSAPTRPGYTFEGYYTGENGTGSLMISTAAQLTENVSGYTDAGGNWIRTDAATLYAKWTQNNYTVSYAAGQHGSITGSDAANYDTAYSDTLVPNTGYALPASLTMTMDGVSFTDFTYDSATGAVTIEAKKLLGDLVISGSCTPIRYTMEYSLDGGTVETENPSEYTVESADITLHNPTKTGYTFIGWSGTDLTGEANMSVTIATGSTGNRSYTAHWTPNSYTVAYSGNKPADASGSVTEVPENQSCTYDADFILKEGPTLTGYTFGGWYEEENCDNLTGNAGASLRNLTSENGATVTLYAKWTANRYTVAYQGNDSTGGSMTPSTHTYDVAQDLCANAFERKYTVTYDHNYIGSTDGSDTAVYPFAGWNMAADGTKKSYTGGENVVNLSSGDGATVTLYAQWTAESVTLPTPDRLGYTFHGWYDAADGGTLVGNGGDAYTPQADITLYALWTLDVYGISLNPSTNVTFPSAIEGDRAPVPHLVTIENVGNKPTGDLSITLSGKGARGFTLSRTTVSSIGVTDSARFTVVPSTYLSEGTYTAIVTVSGDEKIAEQRFTVSFTVKRARAPIFFYPTPEFVQELGSTPEFVPRVGSTQESASKTDPASAGSSSAADPASPGASSATDPTSPDSSSETDSTPSGSTSETEPSSENPAQISDWSAALVPSEEIHDEALRSEYETENPDAKVQVFDLRAGQVIVTVLTHDGVVMAELSDQQAVIAAVLTQDELEQVADGVTFEIRLDVRLIQENVSESDTELIETAIERFGKEIPDLTLGGYIEITLSKRVSGGKWQVVSDVGELTKIVIEIPAELRRKDAEFYVIRAHDGESTLLEDQDSNPDTVTILTQFFSTYAIAYRAAMNVPSPAVGHWIVLGTAIAFAAFSLLWKNENRRKRFLSLLAGALLMLAIALISLLTKGSATGLFVAIGGILVGVGANAKQLFGRPEKTAKV